MSVTRISVDVRGHIAKMLAEGVGHIYADMRPDLHFLQSLHDDNDFWHRTSLEPSFLRENLYLKTREGLLRRQFIFQNCAYHVAGNYTEEEKLLLVQDVFDSERRKFERLRHKFKEANRTASRIERPGIPEEVRIAVWRRDSGRCSRCGSRERLEYDHIIPISRGGSNTTRNIELLCEICNRSKGDEIV